MIPRRDTRLDGDNNVQLRPAIFLFIALSGLAACDHGHDHAGDGMFSAQQISTARSLRDEALAGSGSYALLEELIDVAPKRMAGSAGDVAARDWAAYKLGVLGFDKVWVQMFTMQGWARVGASGTVDSHDLELDITALGKSVSTPEGGVTAEVVHFETFADLAAADASDVEGRIVFISNRMERKKDGSGYGPANIARGRGHQVTAQKGGLALLIRSIGTDDHDAPHTGAMRFGENGISYDEEEMAYVEAWNAPYGEQTVAAAAISNADADAFEALFAGDDPVTVSLDIRNENPGEITSYNVIGEITGASRPDEIVITGGHIDAWDTGVGAMDDGMGVALTMNAAAMIGALPEHPARTIRYVAFGAEELGLLGAYAYAEEYGDDDHVFGIESDFGIGRVWQLSPRVSDDAKPVLEAIWEAALKDMGLPWAPGSTGYPGPDLSPLVQRGLAGASLNGDGTYYFDLHHTAEDSLDKIRPEDLDYNTAAYAALLYLVAESDARFDNWPDEAESR